MTREKIIITTDKLSIGYPEKGGSKIIKSNISLHASSGELIALIGGNGVGKSTLLKTLAGFQPCISGSILIKGKNLYDYREKELAKLLSFVSTEIINVANLTVFDLVSLGRYPHTNWSGRLTDPDRIKVEEAIGMVGLQGYEKRMVNFISDGERQKTMIARTLAQDTDLILLDEPTAFLDLSNKYEIVHLLHKLAGTTGKTILFSTHDLTTAIAECDRIWLMLEEDCKQGAPEDLILDGSFSSLFHNKNLFFDPEKGDYCPVKNPRQKIIVKGEGISYNWTIKALEKNGYQIMEKVDSLLPNDLLTIEVSYPTWTLNFQNSQKRFDSIYHLCRYLKET